MSSVSNSGRYFKWNTKLPCACRDACESPIFLFQNTKCFFKLTLQWPDYRIYFIRKDSSEKLKPFRLQISVTHRGFDISQKNVSVSDRCRDIWKLCVSDLEKELESRAGFCDCTFEFLFMFESSLQLQLVESKAINETVQIPVNFSIPCHQSLSQDFSKLLEDKPKTPYDMELKCGDHTIPAHKIVLGTRSEVFSAMLDSDMVEGRTGLVEIEDVDATLMQEFVRYLYTGETSELNLEKAKKLYGAGDKYAVESLTTKCAQFLESNLTDENSCEILALADAHNDDELKETVLKYIVDKKVNIQNDRWLPFMKNHSEILIALLNRLIQKQ